MERTRSFSKATFDSLIETFRVAVVLSLVCLAVAVSAASAITLPAGWSHAQVNVVIKHVGHTLIYDRGSITRVAQASLTLKESDSSIVVIRVAPSAAVTLGGRPVALLTLRPGEFAQTVRVDGAPAQQVRAHKVGATG